MARPLTLLLTRPLRQSQAFAKELELRFPGRFAPVISPLIEIVPVPGDLDLNGVEALLFTSANGVEQFALRTPQRAFPALCVGDITAAAARAAGFEAHSADGDVAALTGLARAFHKGHGVFLHVRGRHAAGDLTGRLAEAGIPVRAAEIYGQTPCPAASAAAARLANGQIEIVTLFSPRTARLFAQEARANGWPLGTVTSVCLSAAADAALGPLAFARRLSAPAPNRAGMLAALSDL